MYQRQPCVSCVAEQQLQIGVSRIMWTTLLTVRTGHADEQAARQASSSGVSQAWRVEPIAVKAAAINWRLKPTSARATTRRSR
jgi:uncharacterized membrane protein